MNVEIQYKLKFNPNDIKYLREKSYWYKYLNRNKSYFKNFEDEMKKFDQGVFDLLKDYFGDVEND